MQSERASLRNHYELPQAMQSTCIYEDLEVRDTIYKDLHDLIRNFLQSKELLHNVKCSRLSDLILAYAIGRESFTLNAT